MRESQGLEGERDIQIDSRNVCAYMRDELRVRDVDSRLARHLHRFAIRRSD